MAPEPRCVSVAWKRGLTAPRCAAHARPVGLRAIVPRRPGHGWWPYLAPLFSFLALLELGRRAGPTYEPAFALASVLVPFAVLLYHAVRTGYPELRGLPPGVAGLAGDVAVGLAGAALWVAPYLFVAALRPAPDADFDPALFGASREWLALSLRAAMEEGATEYDLLHGAESYKFLWARRCRSLSRFELHPPTPGSGLRHWLRRGVWMCKDGLRSFAGSSAGAWQLAGAEAAEVKG